MTRPMTAPIWGAAKLREDVAARLLAYRTIAEDHVETSRANPLPDAALPAIVVHTPIETGVAHAEAGSAPEFDATVTLHIELRVIATATETAGQLLDRLVAETLDCLLSDPDWTSRYERITSRNVRTNFPDDASKSIGEADVVLEVHYIDRYEPREAVTFTGADFNPPGMTPPPPPGAIAPPIRVDTTPPPPPP
jgi:hypothetical protein